MDLDIVTSILKNSGIDISRFKLKNCKSQIEDDKLQSRNPELISTLAKSLATLLCHKVSPAAHQRYLVRTNLIELLRDWSRVLSRYSHLQYFTDGEQTTKFAIRLVNKYLTEDFIEKQSCVDILVKLGFMIIDMKSRNSNFNYKLDNIINRILYLGRTADSDIFVDYLIENYEDLSLDLTTISNIYVCKSEKLIEIPIIDSFIIFNDNYANGISSRKTTKNHFAFPANDASHPLSKLLKYSSKSPCIFQLLSSILKEIALRTNWCTTIVDFIQFVIKHISKLCTDENKYIVDLYPRKLQCTVILLRIEPQWHTHNSKNYTLQNLTSIYGINKQELLILLTHFPVWLIEFSNFVYGSNELL